MKIRICSESKAIELAKTQKCKTSIISITCPKDDIIKFIDSDYIISIFHMKFNDIDHDKIPSIPAPKQADFIGLKDFIDSLDCDELIIHCGAGISRSAAVAAAISDYFHIEHHIFNDLKYAPNRLVYSLSCIELGIQPIKDEEYYQTIFKDTID